ncbi:hypothetical protein [Pseudoruegeria sp. HB172150]|uniref:hypothetical protein n=1 Tax=Pseudoruegeria sp. HB172150 TaxID=2721164 RepID=UPI0015575E69|nr:hypothetical protein [Pseudoruegeria sp. HB172150]
MKDSQVTVESLMADIARYERTIGDLLARNDALAAEIAGHEAARRAQFDNRQNENGTDIAALMAAVMRLALQQGRNTDAVLRLLSGMRGEETPELTERLDLSAAYVQAIDTVLAGRSVERISDLRIAVEPEMRVRGVRGEVLFSGELDKRGRSSVLLRENREKGVHALIFPLGEVTVTGLRGVSLEILPRELGVVRLRLRQGDDYGNHAEVSVDLASGRYANLRSGVLPERQGVTVRELSGGWKSILFESALAPAGGAAELEVIALKSLESVSSQRPGTGKECFALRSLKALRSDGLVAREVADAEREMRGEAPAPTAIEYRLKMPAEEARRAEKRAAYLASGAYRALSRFRDIHRGRRAFLIGNGPSINGQDLTLLKDEVTFVTNWFVNHPDYEAIDPGYYCVSSHEMFGGWNAEAPKPNAAWLEKMLLKAGGTQKFFSFAFRELLLGGGIFPPECCDFLLFDRPKYQVDLKGDINLDLTQPMDDGYTGIITFCLPLAHFMGIREIYLLGCDCDYGPIRDGAPKSYFYDFAQHGTRTTSDEGLLRVWAEGGPAFKAYEVVRDRFALDGIKIVNCTDGGRLEVFPRLAYEQVLGRG